MSGGLVVTTSWDDGHPADLRVADMLARHGLAGTFYVPSRNSEGRDVMTASQVRHLSASFEIGGHGRDHVVLTGLTRVGVEEQVSQNRAWLAEVTGQPPRGFCYIRGEWDAQAAAVVRSLGFAYARAVTGFHANPGGDPFSVPTTMQFHPQGAAPILRHLLRRGPTPSRTRLALVALRHPDLVRRVEAMVEACRAGGGHFHLWGHSWELEALDLWGQLDTALGLLAGLKGEAQFLTNDAALVAAGLIPAP
jgi:hypothetical protein